MNIILIIVNPKKGENIMQEEFVKEVTLSEKTQEELNIELIKSIMKTKMDLENSSTNYEYAEDELIDYYLYQIKANQAKLNYLLRKAKKSGIILDRIKELELRKMKYIEDTDVV